MHTECLTEVRTLGEGEVTSSYQPPVALREGALHELPSRRRESSTQSASEELRLIAALRAGDEQVFSSLVDRYHGALLRLAGSITHNTAVAEEVVQETWLGLLQGLDRFEWRSSLKTWLFTILVTRARTRSQRESRCVSFSSLGHGDEASESSDDRASSLAYLLAEVPGELPLSPRTWGRDPEKLLLSQELRWHVESAIDELPAKQREVITLRDVLGWTSEEICNVLEIGETNLRVLLHRARTHVREVIEHYLNGREQSRGPRRRASHMHRVVGAGDRVPRKYALAR